MNVRVIVLAAGLGTRFGSSQKLTAEVSGSTLIDWTLRLLASQIAGHSSPQIENKQSTDTKDRANAPHCGSQEILVVTNSAEVSEIAASFTPTFECELKVSTTAAPNSERGIGWSLRAGIDYFLRGSECSEASSHQETAAPAVTAVEVAAEPAPLPATGLHVRHRGVFVVLADDPIACLALDTVADAATRSPESIVSVNRPTGAPHPVYIPWSMASNLSPEKAPDGLGPWIRSIDSDSHVRVDSTELPQPIDVDVKGDIAILESKLSQLAEQL